MLRMRSLIVLVLLSSPGMALAATRSASSCSRDAVAAAIAQAVDGDTVVIPAGTCTWTTNLTIDGKILTLQGAGIDQTVIVDGVSKDPWTPTNPNVPQVILWKTKEGGLTRITGITFQGGTIVDGYNKGMVVIDGSSKSWRVDNCHFITTQTHGLAYYGFTFGVVDHNVFDLIGWHYGIYGFHPNWNNQGPYGDGSWADDSYLGTEKAVFIEDNVFRTSTYSVAHDGWSGERVVFRKNTVTNAVFGNHGTESGGRLRGARTFEVYDNTFTLNNSAAVTPTVVGLRSGVGVIFNNSLTFSNGAYAKGVADVTDLRADHVYVPWGQCGTVQDPVTSRFGVYATQSDAQANIVTVYSVSPWLSGPNPWLSSPSPWDGNTDLVSTGKTSGYPCIDQIGFGKGDLITGDVYPAGNLYTLVNAALGKPAWPRQQSEPTYAWNNKMNGAVSSMVGNRAVVQENRDFFNAVKPGYTPYVYPHPLVSGSPAPAPTPTPIPTLAAPGAPGLVVQ